MAESKPKKKQSNPLVGSQAQPTTLTATTALDIDTNKTLMRLVYEYRQQSDGQYQSRSPKFQ